MRTSRPQGVHTSNANLQTQRQIWQEHTKPGPPAGSLTIGNVRLAFAAAVHTLHDLLLIGSPRQLRTKQPHWCVWLFSALSCGAFLICLPLAPVPVELNCAFARAFSFLM